MKFTKLFSAALCGTVLLASCSFNGTEGTFSEDLKAKYENNDSTEIYVYDSSTNSYVTRDTLLPALTISFSGFTSKTDDDGKIVKWTAYAYASKALASTDGISLSTVSGTDEKAVYSFAAKACTIQFDETDSTKETVEIIVASEDAPENCVLKADAAVVKAVDGSMLDGDGDGYWGEAEDSVYRNISINSSEVKGYYLTGRETASLPFWTVASKKDNDGHTVADSYVVSCSAHEDDKATLDQYYWIEEYDAESDKWEKATISTIYSSSTETYEITYSQSTYKPLRFCQADVNKMKLTYEPITGLKLVLPTTTEKHPQASAADNDVTTLNTVSANKDDYMYLEYISLPTPTNEGNGVIEISAPSVPSTYYRDVKGDKEVSATAFKKYAVADGSIKVYRKNQGHYANNGSIKASVEYTELKAKVSVIDEGKTIRIELEDTELSSSEYNNLIIIANKGLTATYDATVEGTADSSVTMKYGTLEPATSTITKGGWKVIKGSL